jgi:ribosomal protein S18 acetylase RimI-like enzyme
MAVDERGTGPVRLERSSIGAASEMMARAFYDDPHLIDLIPEPDQRSLLGGSYFEFVLRFGMRYGRVYAASPSLEGAAVWLPSDRSEITLWRALLSGGMGLQRRFGSERMKRLTAFSDLVDRYHRRHAPQPHCYLFYVGVDPKRQGSGYASRLLRPVFAALDRLRLPCYLTTQNENNIRLYEHFGFGVIEQVTPPGTTFVHTGMLRPPRSS